MLTAVFGAGRDSLKGQRLLAILEQRVRDGGDGIRHTRRKGKTRLLRWAGLWMPVPRQGRGKDPSTALPCPRAILVMLVAPASGLLMICRIGRLGRISPWWSMPRSTHARLETAGWTHAHAATSHSDPRRAAAAQLHAPSGQAQMHTRLPSRSARVRRAGAEPSTTRSPAASAATRRPSTCSRATDTSTCIACCTGLASSRSCIRTHRPVAEGSTAWSSSSSAYPRTARQKPTSTVSGCAASASWTSCARVRSAAAPCCRATIEIAQASATCRGCADRRLVAR